ncbi:MAG: PPC domain-containing DNA-binding protein [Candidatus Aminicenantales bacterium]
MKTKAAGGTWIIRLETGEPIVASLQSFCEKEKIRAGAVAGIGTCRRPTLAFFDWDKKSYHAQTLPGDFEIAALTGNISVFEGRVLAHLHVTLGDADFQARAGHLREAETLAVCELIVTPLPGEIIRRTDPETGLNQWEL